MYSSKIRSQIGYAIVPKGTSELCYTSDWMDRTVWQIYKDREDALEFLKVKFADAEYEIVEVIIS